MQPLAQPPKKDEPRFDDWMYRLWSRIASNGGLSWLLVDKTGSNLTDIATRNHSDLQNIAGGTFHLTTTQAALIPTGVPTAGQVPTATSGTASVWATPPASGDVVGPASSIDGNVVLFNGITGKLIKDSGLALSGSNTGDQTNITGNAGTADVALGLKSATTTVIVGAATAPSAGQVLTASSGTAATWVTPAAGGASVLYNVISVPTTIPADTSYPVISYLTVNSDLTINGNLMVIG